MATLESSVCVVVLLTHLFLAVVIGIALEIRYGYYGDTIFRILPGEMMALPLQHTSMFCDARTVRVLYEDGFYRSGVYGYQDNLVARPRRSAQNSGSNGSAGFAEEELAIPYRATQERNYFNLYHLESQPKVVRSNSRHIRYRYEDVLVDGGHRKSLFHLLAGSKIDGSACSHTQGEYSGFWIYLIRGVSHYQSWLKAHRSSYITHCDLKSCAASLFIPTHKQCGSRTNQTNFTMQIDSSDDYVMVYYLPSVGLVEDLLSFDIHLDIDSMVYSPTVYQYPVCKHVLNCTAPSHERLLLDMAYYTDEVLTPDDTLLVLSTCTPKVLLYVGIFFIGPLLILTIFIFAFFERRRRRQASFMERFNAQGINYGSLDTTSTYDSSSLRAVPPTMERNPSWANA